MKLVLVIFAVLGLAYAAPTRTLQEDLDDFLSLIPGDEMREIARRYLETDAEFQQVVEYLRGPEWAELVDHVANNASWQEFKAYLTEAGIDVEGIIQWIHDLINGNLPPKSGKQTRGMREFLDEILAIIPADELLVMLDDKLQNSPDFQDFFAEISSDEARALVEEVRALEEVQRIAQVLREMGVDVDTVIAFIYGILGWN